ncbi:MAG: hypothetical protein M3120_03535, partial [Pseudomonadota bacterium]|nr:hypothetical protein [Pseudomonadota bacterium]
MSQYDPPTTLTLQRSLVSGNTAPSIGREIDAGNPDYHATVNVASFNQFGHSGSVGLAGVTPGATDIVPTQTLPEIINVNLAPNGGTTRTHALV